MRIKSIVATTAIALVAGIGSVSADEVDVAATEGNTGTPFAMLDGIDTSEMSVQEMEATRGAATTAELQVEAVIETGPLDTAPPPRRIDSDLIARSNSSSTVMRISLR